MIGGLTLLSLQVVSVPGIAAEPQAPAASPVAQVPQVQEQEFLLFAVVAQRAFAQRADQHFE